MSFVAILLLALARIVCANRPAENVTEAPYSLHKKYEDAVCTYEEIQDIEDYPYFAKICNAKICFCGGTILSENWVVTAGHCVYRNENFLKIITGNGPMDQSKNRTVIRTVLHPKFGVRPGYLKISNNVALLRVDSKFSFDSYGVKIRPALHPPIEGMTYPLITIGYGIPRKYKVKILSQRQCRHLGICPSHAYSSDGCHLAGDFETGGPMIDGPDLLGIASLGQSPLRKTFAPGVVFSQICDYADWMETVLKT